MIARVPLLFCLLASLASVDASALLRKSEPSVRTASRAHRRSENFIRDLRLAYSGIRTRRSDPSSGSQTPFCVNLATNDSSLAKGSNSNGGDGARSAASVSTTASGRVRPSATSSRAPAASSSAAASSPWKLKQSYVSMSFFECPNGDLTRSLHTGRKLVLRWLGFLHRHRPDRWHGGLY